MGRGLRLILAGALLAPGLAGQAPAHELPAPAPTAAASVAARAHLIYRAEPKARPIEGRVTVLQPAGAAAPLPPDGAAAQVHITITQIAQR